ncbi:S8 family peptidase [Thiocystis violascens]|uniref:Subtilisin-like serine protease n=1 Tax=Thiocystis violascens (strain ATCC 17096 / DSM 198 / 6111) TaxID=765911 RepID=I3Y6Q2_THIV6|nr:S8 family serine peptidase [Thiocystis violascens]AFL72670.1 subtilisin-like serine protease [Thiocystis violascens DSM 198]
MKTKHQHRIGQLLLSLLGLVLVFSALAGTPLDTMDPAVTTQDWESFIDPLMTTNAPAAELAQRRDGLLEQAFERGAVPVIVRLKAHSNSRPISRTALSESQQRLLDRLGLQDGRDRVGSRVKRFDRAQGLAMQADAIDVQDLLDDPEVLDVFEDKAYSPALIESLPLIGATGNSVFAGYSGQGQVIAILDTGVDKNHPFLAGKVVSEACYSSSYSSQGSTSLCPGGASESTAVNSGLNCNAGIDGCSHGTHVAGIAAGRGANFSGVARDAQLIAIQIYSRFPARECGGARCVMAYTSDIIKGLERVYALRNSYPIAAANLSLGGDVSTTTCDRDPTKPIIDALRGVGIATVIASGNGGYTNAIGAPGCVSTAVTVGSTTKSDEMSSFSNNASFLDLLAPGSVIYSSIIGNGFQTWNGTSMAAPHVAGAWAVLKSARPTATVDAILTALQATGVPINDAGLVKPRIEIADAIDLLNTASKAEGGDSSMPSAIPAAPTINTASHINSSGFTANWSESAGADGYRLDLSTTNNFRRFVNGYRDRDMGDGASARITGLVAGTIYFYRIRAYNASGVSDNAMIRGVITKK